MKRSTYALFVSSLLLLGSCKILDEDCRWNYAIKGKIYSGIDSMPLVNKTFKVSTSKPWSGKEKEEVLQTFTTNADGSFSLADVNACKYEYVAIMGQDQDFYKLSATDTAIAVIETRIGDNHNTNIDLGTLYVAP